MSIEFKQLTEAGAYLNNFFGEEGLDALAFGDFYDALDGYFTEDGGVPVDLNVDDGLYVQIEEVLKVYDVASKSLIVNDAEFKDLMLCVNTDGTLMYICTSTREAVDLALGAPLNETVALLKQMAVPSNFADSQILESITEYFKKYGV